jgi:hypothetical protein
VGARALPVIDGTARYLAHFGLLVRIRPVWPVL